MVSGETLEKRITLIRRLFGLREYLGRNQKCSIGGATKECTPARGAVARKGLGSQSQRLLDGEWG